MLHVLVGPTCNNHCRFCMEDDRARRQVHIGGQSDADVREMLRSYPARDEVLFTSGEPTLNPHLPEYVALARELGYRTVALISNGRRLSYPAYLAGLVRAGLTKLTVSIHGHEARLHDGLTRTRGSFEQTRAALENVTALKQRRRLEVTTSTVLCTKNLPSLPAIHAFLTPFAIDRMVFNVMMARGLGARHFDRLMAPYAQVVGAFRDLVAGLPADEVRRVCLMDVPACATEDLPREVRGEVELYEQFEHLGSTGHRGREVVLDDRDWERFGPPVEDDDTTRLRGEILAPDLAADGQFYLAKRTRKDAFARVKREACASCRYEPACPGVWRTYAERRGWDEFEPVRRPG